MNEAVTLSDSILCKARIMSTDQLLSEEEFDELDHFLMSDRCGDEAMTMDALHGYLTAIAVGPGPVAVAEWLPSVWGPDEEDAPLFKNEQEAARISTLMQRMLQEITLTLEVAPKDFEPLFCEHEWQGKQVLDAEAWAWGFMEGISLREAAWQALRDAPQASLLRPIYLLGAEEIEEEEVALVDDPVKCHKLAMEIEASISQIDRFWKAQRKPVVH
jgi:uncharacterized protein